VTVVGTVVVTVVTGSVVDTVVSDTVVVSETTVSVVSLVSLVSVVSVVSAGADRAETRPAGDACVVATNTTRAARPAASSTTPPDRSTLRIRCRSTGTTPRVLRCPLRVPLGPISLRRPGTY
jgi:hypothetical protein